MTNKVVNDKIMSLKMTNKVGIFGNEIIRGDFVPLYNKLKKFRSGEGINQAEMGRKVGVSRQTISLIERGDYSPSIVLAIKIARYFHVNVEDIFIYEAESDGEEKENLQADR